MRRACISSFRAFAAGTTVTRASYWSTLSLSGPTNIQIEFKIEPLPRPGESIEHKRARLLYQSRKRGILETDLLLSRFAKTYLNSFNAEQLEEYDRFLDEYDWDIYYWVTDNPQRTVPERWQNSELFKLLRTQVQTQGSEILRMPDL
ncbi:Flavinator of succinate dehydrogenase-domain-containing protein [Lipomyces doorenjongii]